MKKLKAKIASVLTACVMLSGTAAVVPTQAAETDYGDALKLSLYFYDANECGNEVDDNPLTWRGNCHTYDGTANINSAIGLDEAAKQVIRQQTGGDTVDVSGGYHDAGDHLKSSMTMGFSATSLAWSYYSYSAAFDNTGSTAHLRDILKKMCDYFMKVTYLNNDGSVAAFCYLVSDESDHSEWKKPEEQTINRPTYWATASHPSADAAGEMAAALASASTVLREVDSAYADECLKYAKALHSFAKQYPQATYDGIGGLYDSGSQQDDIAWADLWIHVAEGSVSSYTPVAVNGDVYQTPNGKDQYDGWIYSWDKVWGGYSALLYELGNTSHEQVVRNNANLISNPQAGKYYFPKGGTEWGSSRYNCAWQMYALKYAERSGQSQYASNAKTQMDYLLGGNPAGRSYLLGYGDNYPKNVHHRAANTNKNGMEHVLYGALVGGETDGNGSYNDVWDSYSCTEPALDYNGCFTLAIAGLYNALGGGNGSGADSVIANAPEIDGSHQFGSWYGGSQTNPTEPVPSTQYVYTIKKPDDTVLYTVELDHEIVTYADAQLTKEKLREYGGCYLTYDCTYDGKDTYGILYDYNGELKLEKADQYWVKGDVNLGMSVGLVDVVSLQHYILGTKGFTFMKSFVNADMNCDGYVDVFDLVFLKRKVLGL